jgi:flagellar protein FliO/FliZ
MQSYAYEMLTTLLALVLVLALAYAALRLLRGRMARGATGAVDGDALRFVRALPLGPKERVVLIEHRGERWMLGVTTGSIRLLARWPLADGSAPPEGPPLQSH